MKRVFPEYGLLAVAAFLAPLLGGQLSLDVPEPLGHGMADLFASLHSGPQAALLAWGLLGSLVVASIFFALAKRKVAPVPTTPISWTLALFVACLGFSVLTSGYRWISLASFSSWVLAAAAFFATVALAGRHKGPRAISWAFVAGCSYGAARGIWEYLIQPDPTWRIFSNWFHPNALAALLAMALPIALAAAASEDVRETVFGVLTTALIGSALLLTQSRGGYLFAAVGVLAFGVLMLAWSRGAKTAILRLVKLGFAGVATAIIVFAVVRSPAPTPQPQAAAQPSAMQPGFILVRQGPAPAPASPLSRVSQANTTQEQSAGFRRLLWRTALELTKDNPAGWGLNTFRFHSPRPGLTTQTVLAHNTYLQLATEASILAPLLLVAVGILVLAFSAFGARSMPLEVGLLRAGVIGGVVACAGHNVVDSDLYHFGILLPLFLLLGVLVQLGATGGAPEVIRKWTMLLVGTLPALAAISLIYLGAVDVTLSRAIGAMNLGEVDRALEGIQALESYAPWDGRVTYASVSFVQNAKGRAEKVDEANAKMPNTRFLRTSARFWLEAGEIPKALDRYIQALAIDPNNLPTLSAKLNLERDNGMQWRDTARRLIEVESSPYYQIRSIPEVVPTETAEARVMLAQEQTGTAAAGMLRPAVETYLRFAESTVPRVVQMDAAFPGKRFGDYTVASARQKLEAAINAATRLSEASAESGDAQGMAWADDAATRLRSVRDGLD